MKTFVAEFDLIGSEMERPFDRRFVVAADEAEAEQAAKAKTDRDEELRRVVALDPILDGIAVRIAEGVRYGISWKDEGEVGPVTITDLDAFEAQAERREDGSFVRSIPFGSDPDYTTNLPWMRRSDAKRLAKSLSLVLEES